MFELNFVLLFLDILAILALSVYKLGAAIKRQANKPVKRFFAPIPRPGSFSFISLEGKIRDTLENVYGWKLKEQKNVGGAKCFTLGERDKPKSLLQYLLQEYLGVIWVGFFATIKVFPDWKWLEFKQVDEKNGSENTPRYKIVARSEPVSEFFFQFPYPVTLEDAEIKGNIRVEIETLITVWHLCPERAFFLNKDPVAIFNAMVRSALRSYVIERDFDAVKAIRASKDSGPEEDESFWKVLEELNGLKLKPGTNEPDYDTIDHLGLFGKLGYFITRAEVTQVEAVGGTAAALEAKRLAELRGDAEVAAAEKAAAATIARAKGDASAMDTRREARKNWVQDTIVTPTGGPGPQVAEVLVAEHVAGSKLTTWVEGGNGIGLALPLQPTADKPERLDLDAKNKLSKKSK